MFRRETKTQTTRIQTQQKADSFSWLKYVAVFVLVASFLAMMFPAQPVSAAAVKCYSATADAHANEIPCDNPSLPGLKDTLLDFAGVGSLDELADRCFSISIDWAEIDCATDVSEANAPRCIKENPDEKIYEAIECADSGSTFSFEERKCYAITADNVVTEHGCLDSAYIALSAGTYPGGKYDDASSGSGGASPTVDNAPTTCTSGDISDRNDCPIVGYLVLAINVLSAAVGLIVIAVIIASGIQYSAARNDPQAVAKAKGRIYSSVLALAVYIFIWTFLQWVIPGGVLN